MTAKPMKPKKAMPKKMPPKGMSASDPMMKPMMPGAMGSSRFGAKPKKC